jgi:hypothetical protein
MDNIQQVCHFNYVSIFCHVLCEIKVIVTAQLDSSADIS